MKYLTRPSRFSGALLAILVVALIGCGSRVPAPTVAEAIAPIPADAWREIKEGIWTASALAQAEADTYAGQAMREWMARVRERVDADFIPWYSGYWTQQWIGIKASWYEMNREDGDGSVERYVAQYLLEAFHDLVLEPAAVPSNPQTISSEAAAIYVRLLSQQLQCMPRLHAVPTRSLRRSLSQIPLITLSGSDPANAMLSEVLDRGDLAGTAAYDALISRWEPVGGALESASGKRHLDAVAEDSVSQYFADLPLRAGGGAAATVVGEALGLFISAGVAAWSAVTHDQEKPAIESALKEALDAGLQDMWHGLMEDPERGVLYPVRHMSGQVESGLFPVREPGVVVPF